MFWYFLLQNTCVWLQWLGFEGKHAMLCIRGFNYQALIRNMLVFQQSPHLRSSNLCILQAICHILGKSPCFPYKKWPVFGATLLRVFGEISLISPQKSYICYCCVPLNHCIKLKFYAFWGVCSSKLCLLWHFHSKISNSMLHVMSSVYVQL